MSVLDLPDSFSTSPGLPGRLEPWGALALIGLGLCGSRFEELLADPLWPVLCALEGLAPGELPGMSIPNVADYRLPATWYQRLHASPSAQTAGFCWAETSKGDLLIWADEGFLVMRESRSTALASEQVQSLLASYLPDNLVCFLSPSLLGIAPLAKLESYLVDKLSPGAAGWLVCVVPYITHLLRTTLLLKPEDDLIEHLLRARGLLYTTRTHLDLILPLESISIPVRSAGLDRDPGWLSHFGRVIQFHYE